MLDPPVMETFAFSSIEGAFACVPQLHLVPHAWNDLDHQFSGLLSSLGAVASPGLMGKEGETTKIQSSRPFHP